MQPRGRPRLRLPRPRPAARPLKPNVRPGPGIRPSNPSLGQQSRSNVRPGVRNPRPRSNNMPRPSSSMPNRAQPKLTNSYNGSRPAQNPARMNVRSVRPRGARPNMRTPMRPSIGMNMQNGPRDSNRQPRMNFQRPRPQPQQSHLQGSRGQPRVRGPLSTNRPRPVAGNNFRPPRTFNNQSNPRNIRRPAPGPPRSFGGPRQQANISQSQFTPQIELDYSCNCSEQFTDVSVSKFPASNVIHDQSTIPISCVICPLAETSEKSNIPVVNFHDCGVIRCRKCRAYINPFVVWLENGRKWQCNFCPTQNETPPNYYRHLDEKYQRVDKAERPELSQGCIEIVAPSEYMVRPPMPPVYVFCFELTRDSINTGMLGEVIRTIRHFLDSFPGASRTQVGFLAFDEAIHFYNLRSDLTSPQVLTVSNLDDTFLPLPEELLVNLEDSKSSVESLLDSLEALVNNIRMSSDQSPNIPQNQKVSVGGAINAAYNVMAHIGGRLHLFVSSLPTAGPGKLTPRGMNNNILGTMSEHAFLRPNVSSSLSSKPVDGNAADGESTSSTFYKAKATEYSRQQICCDLFVLPNPGNSYTDLATISEISKYTGGDVYYYGQMPVEVGLVNLSKDLERCLSRETGWEAVMRLRVSSGLIPKGFYGNFLLRGNDLMALPSVSADSAFTVEFSFDTNTDKNVPGMPLRKDLTAPVAFQTALLYTNSDGERRIRVITKAIPLASNVSEVLQGVRLSPIVNLFAKKGVDIASGSGLDDYRRKLQNKCIEILRAYRSTNSIPSSVSGNINEPPSVNQGSGPKPNIGISLPPSMQDFPRYIMGIMKSQAFRGGSDVSLDHRVALFNVVSRMSINDSSIIFNPKLYDLSRSDFASMNPTILHLKSNSLFLLNTGLQLFIWLGESCSKTHISSLFGVSSLNDVDETQLSIALESKCSEDAVESKSKIVGLISEIRRSQRGTPYPTVYVVKEGNNYGDYLFKTLLLEDRQQFNGGTMSLDEFTGFLTQSSQGSSGYRR